MPGHDTGAREYQDLCNRLACEKEADKINNIIASRRKPNPCRTCGEENCCILSHDNLRQP